MQRRLLFKRSRDYLFCYSLRCRNERSVLHKLSKTIGYLFEKTRQNYVHEFFFFFLYAWKLISFSFLYTSKMGYFFRETKTNKIARVCEYFYTRRNWIFFKSYVHFEFHAHRNCICLRETNKVMCTNFFYTHKNWIFFGGFHTRRKHWILFRETAANGIVCA